VTSVGIAVACALIIIAHAPAILTDPLFTAIAQIRVNAATTSTSADQVGTSISESSAQSVTKKAK
jgi:uncharacterized protein involved in exopolysaccharide biosynthesis